MKDFVVEEALPFLGVCAATLGLTLTLFDVPASAPSNPAARTTAEPALTASANQAPERARSNPAEPARESIPSALVPRLDALNALLAQALRGQERAPNATPPSGSPAPPGPAVAPTAPPAATVDPNLLAVVPSLGQAIQAVHDVRTEDDLVRAESMMHSAADQMQAACGSSGGPLCDSARQMHSLGY